MTTHSAISTSTRKQRPVMKITFATASGGSAPPSSTAATGPATVADTATPRHGRWWAICGAVAGALGLVQFALVGGLGIETSDLADNELLAEAVTD